MAYFNDFAQVNMDNWEHLPLHELCTLFPNMSESDYDSLVESMRENGFLSTDPITLVLQNEDWYVLDGRNRLNAAIDAKVKPTFVEFLGNDLLGFVMARNMDRRHLTTGQKAAIAAELSKEMKQADAAKRMGVGEASLRRYKFVQDRDPVLAEKVAKGEVKLESARQQIKEAEVVDKLDSFNRGTLTAEEYETEKQIMEKETKPKLGDKRKARRASLVNIDVDVSFIIAVTYDSEKNDYPDRLADLIAKLEGMGAWDLEIMNEWDTEDKGEKENEVPNDN